MKLDPQIIEGKKPLTCFDVEQAKEFLGKECYFSSTYCAFEDLHRIPKAELQYISNDKDASDPYKTACYYYPFCLPCEWVKEKKEPKYRPFKDHAEYKEYLNDGIIESWIQIREKLTGKVSELMYVGGSETTICLGAYSFILNDLFTDFELFNESTGEWQPFGVIDIDEEGIGE